MPNLLFIKFLIVCTSAVVRGFQIFRAERAPAVRTVNILIRNVMQTYGNSEHARQRNQVFPYMPVCERSVICAPIRHHVIYA